MSVFLSYEEVTAEGGERTGLHTFPWVRFGMSVEAADAIKFLIRLNLTQSTGGKWQPRQG